jgi:hypothetical protein
MAVGPIFLDDYGLVTAPLELVAATAASTRSKFPENAVGILVRGASGASDNTALDLASGVGQVSRSTPGVRLP